MKSEINNRLHGAAQKHPLHNDIDGLTVAGEIVNFLSAPNKDILCFIKKLDIKKLNNRLDVFKMSFFDINHNAYIRNTFHLDFLECSDVLIKGLKPQNIKLIEKFIKCEFQTIKDDLVMKLSIGTNFLD